MGGRGSSSGAGSSAGGPAGGAVSAAEATRLIKRTPFTDNGGGNWELDIPGVGGGQILDETGGSRDPMYGMGGKVYSIQTWNGDYSMFGTTEYISGSLNNAKQALKDRLLNLFGGRG